MNKEVIKAMNKVEKDRKIAKWWNKNSYKVAGVILFPIWFGFRIKEKIEQKLDSRVEWSDERVEKILDYYVPRYASWDEETKTFYFFDNGYGWDFCRAKRLLKRRDRRFWKVHRSWAGGDIRKYLIHEFELEGFTKEILDTDNSWTEIKFKMIENRVDK